MVPRSVAFEGPAEVVEPELTVTGVALAKVGAIEEDDIENLGEVIGVFVGVGETINEEISFLRVLLGEEGVDFGDAGDAAEEVEVDSAEEGGVVGWLGRGHLFFLPLFPDELIDDRGGVFGGIGEDEFDGGCDFEIGDPGLESCDFLGGELLFRRHVGIGAHLDELKEWALFGVAWNEGGIGLAAFKGGFDGAEIKSALLLNSAVALGAVVDNDRVNL